MRSWATGEKQAAGAAGGAGWGRMQGACLGNGEVRLVLVLV